MTLTIEVGTLEDPNPDVEIVVLCSAPPLGIRSWLRLNDPDVPKIIGIVMQQTMCYVLQVGFNHLCINQSGIHRAHDHDYDSQVRLRDPSLIRSTFRRLTITRLSRVIEQLRETSSFPSIAFKSPPTSSEHSLPFIQQVGWV